MEKLDTLKNKVRIRKSRKGRERLLILNTEEGVVEEDIIQAVEDLVVDRDYDLEVVNRYTTRNGKKNWILELDSNVVERLLVKGKICLNFKRCRMVRHVNIVRCNKCQKYGHFAVNCSEEQVCYVCAGKHSGKACTVTELSCINCIRDGRTMVNHRANDTVCPIFRSYRDTLQARL